MSIVPSMADSDVQFKLIIPAALKRRLDDSASDSRRSLSAEIVHQLEVALDIVPELYREKDEAEAEVQRLGMEVQRLRALEEARLTTIDALNQSLVDREKTLLKASTVIDQFQTTLEAQTAVVQASQDAVSYSLQTVLQYSGLVRDIIDIADEERETLPARITPLLDAMRRLWSEGNRVSTQLAARHRRPVDPDELGKRLDDAAARLAASRKGAEEQGANDAGR
ncbi:MAG: hypothetical protein EOO82_00445 [Oxalobacteraceae bacterium]|nr:MAG: hypothetical protein EOO82_00445 [Oxalobacteraceae bacterium]